jgi:hypothetical protein
LSPALCSRTGLQEHGNNPHFFASHSQNGTEKSLDNS